jgi:hypothetical protein
MIAMETNKKLTYRVNIVKGIFFIKKEEEAVVVLKGFFSPSALGLTCQTPNGGVKI